jgi:hypothetical protein
MIQQLEGSGTEHTPTASSSRLMLETFGPALTTSQVFTSVSDTVLIGGIASGGDAMARLVGEKPGANGKGMSTGVSCTPPSDVGLPALALDVVGSVDDNRDELARLVVEDFFVLQGRGMVGVDSSV